MNVPISRLFGLIVVLFAVLVAFTSRWTIFEADALRDNAQNRRTLLEDARVERGRIEARDGTPLARSRKARGDTFRRSYPLGDLFAHVTGYSFTDIGRSGLERSRNDELTGREDEIGSILDQFRGRSREGRTVRTTLDPDAQRVAIRALGGQRGSIVALDPSTGRIRVMANVPSYDPNDIDDPRVFARVNRQEGSPIFNRATQAGYPPGSTFKVVTATAALESGDFTPETTIDGSSPKEISGFPLTNFGNADFGPVTLTRALSNSINTVWAEVAERLGKRRMGETMKRFGFYKKPPLDYPSSQRAASGPRSRGGRLLDPEDPAIDVGRMAIGQDKLAVTPLQMAQVAAAVANGGELMEPRLTEEIVDRDGRAEKIEPKVQERVMSPRTARAVTSMMADVVNGGTGTGARLPGISVAGKTGTAEKGGNVNQVWFIAFAPVDRPRVAIAVTVESSSGQGGTVAAPIARQVLQALL